MQPKHYRTDVRSDSDYSELPAAVEFTIDVATAAEIARLAAIVKSNGLHKVEKFDYRPTFLRRNPEEAPEDGTEPADGEDNEVATDADTLNVSGTDFWFAAYLKHTDVEVLSSRQRIADLLAHFGLGSDVGATSSVPVKHWEAYANPAAPATHQLDVADQRKTNGQIYLDLGAVEGHLDDMLSVAMEVNTNPLNGTDHVPCAHVHFDGDNLAVSLFKVGDKILVRPERDVTIEPFREKVSGITETFYWID